MTTLPMHFGAKGITFKRAKELRAFMTPQEKILWEELNNNQMGLKFRRQHPIDFYIADFYCHQLKLVIEIDGKIHENQVEYDQKRELHFKGFGIETIRFTNEQVVYEMEDILAEIKRRTHPTPLPPLVGGRKIIIQSDGYKKFN